MNSLSWFLYLADTLNSVGLAFMVFGLIAVGVGILGTIAWTICKGSAADALQWSNAEQKQREWNAWSDVWKPIKGYLALGFFLVVLSCLIPSKHTLYAIAASEMGEKIVKNDGVKEFSSDVAKALQNWIKQQLSVPEKKEGK